jgi:hypothetical protein
VPDLLADLLNGQVGLDQEASCLGHAALEDPLLHGAAGLAPDRGREVGRRQVHRRGYVPERDALVVAGLDEFEDVGEQGLRLEPGVADDVGRQVSRTTLARVMSAAARTASRLSSASSSCAAMSPGC